MDKLQQVALAVLVSSSSLSGVLFAAAEVFPLHIRSGRGSPSVPELIEHFRAGFSDEEFGRLQRLLPLLGTGMTVRVLECVAKVVHRETWRDPEEYERFERLLLTRLAADPTIMQWANEDGVIDFFERTVDRVRNNSEFAAQYVNQGDRMAERQENVREAHLEMIRRSGPAWLGALPRELLLMTIDPEAVGSNLAHQYINLAMRIRDIHQENLVTDFLRVEGAQIPAWSVQERYELVVRAYEQAAILLEGVPVGVVDLDLLVERAQVRLWALTVRRLGNLEPDPQGAETVGRLLAQAQALLDHLRGAQAEARLVFSILPHATQLNVEARYRELLIKADGPLQMLLGQMRREYGHLSLADEARVRDGFQSNLFSSVVGAFRGNVPQRLALYQQIISRLQALLAE
ncbi:MAG: hypothetical protein HYW48_02180 [Deltaproteobacteria bacterium]|nr:hypothetical protein [Deltaproteobacteria bacterium]